MARAGAADHTRRPGTAVFPVLLQVVVACCLVAVACFFILDVVIRTPWHHTFDLRVYRGAVQWWLDGRPLYAFIRPHTSLGFTYPPFALLCLLPLGLVSETAATVLITLASSAAILVTTTWLLTPLARRQGWPVWFALAVAVPVAVTMDPVRETLGWGQVSLVLALLVMADVRALERGRPWAGVGIGLASAIKLTPALFIVYLAVTRRPRATAVAAGTAAAATLLAFLIDPSASVTYWTRSLWQLGRIGDPALTTNQSLLGLLARLAAPQPPVGAAWVVLVAVAVGVGLWRAAGAARDGDELTGFTITGLTACLVSPISWTHHIFWVLPATVVLLDLATGTPPARRPGPCLRSHPRAGRRVAATAAVALGTAFALSMIWYFAGATESGRDGPVGVLGENAYTLIMVLLVIVLPARRPATPFAARSPAPPRPGKRSPR